MHANRYQTWLKQLKTARQRAVFVFSPTSAAQRDAIIEGVVALHPALTQLGTELSAPALHHYRDVLGETQQQVLVDMSRGLHLDALAAVAGTVEGGGCLWLILPPQWSAMCERLHSHAQKFALVQWLSSWQEWEALKQLPLPAEKSVTPPEFPSPTQAQIINNMTTECDATHLLMADRGRGKSTTVGLAIKQLQSLSPRQIIVTGPHPRAVATLLNHVGSADKVEFMAWDQLLKRDFTSAPLLVIDEAAALPLHITQQLCAKFQVWAIASTVDGYEGCGKGFAQRFNQWLRKRFQVREHTLTVPLRWAEGDACEQWLNAALLLRSAAPQIATLPSTAEHQWQWCRAHELHEQQLQAVMSLLLEAHYQSSPNDLRLLLDDSSQHLCLLWQQEQLLGVCWLADEAPVGRHLQAAVLKGERRVKGRLLPQALGFYRQQPACLTWHWQRIVRIAIQPQLQRHGLGLKLLNTVIEHAAAQGFCALGSSFGATLEVLAFWQQTPLIEIRRGAKRNMASGEVSAIYALGLKAESQSILTALAELHQAELTWQNAGQVNLTPQLLQQTILPLLKGFTQSHLPFSNIRFAWWYVLTHVSASASTIDPNRLLPTTSYAQLLQLAQVASRAEFERKLRQEVRNWLEEFSSTDNC